MVKSAKAWKELYAQERETLGERGLDELVESAPDAELGPDRAIVFPHTYLAAAGRFVACAARAVVRGGFDEVLAIGVLHGGRPADEELMDRARRGEPDAVRAMRRVHEGGDPNGCAADEYSLDGFAALLERAAAREGRRPPRILRRFPFLVGDAPESLPGIEELARLRDRGCAVVATADPIHHGEYYGTPAGERRAREAPETLAWARAKIERQHALLAAGAWGEFQREAATCRCDFRDAGPVMALLLREKAKIALAVRDLVLVDYCATFGTPAPTWVAGALSVAGPA